MVGLNGIRTSLAVFALFGLSAGLALWWASDEKIWQDLKGLTSKEVAVLLLLSLTNYGLRGLRWSLYLGVQAIRLPLWKNILHYIAGFALTMTPARLGELIRLRWITRDTGARLEHLAPLVLVDRAGDLASTGLLLALVVALGAGGLSGAVPVALLALVAALIATRPVLFKQLVDLAFRVIRRKPRLFAKARRAARALAPYSRLHIIFPALALGAVGWFAEGYAFYLLLDWFGAEVSLWMAVAIFLFAMMTGGATGLPGGVGGAEAAMIALLTLEGVPLEISIPATATIRITTLWFAIGLGALFFPFAEGLKSRTSHALEQH